MLRSGRASVPAVRRLGVIALAVAAAALIAACGGSGRHRRRGGEGDAGDAARPDRRRCRHDRLRADRPDPRRSRSTASSSSAASRSRSRSAGRSRGRRTDSVSTALTIALTAAQSHVAAGLDIVGGVTYLGLGGQFYELGRRSAAPSPATGSTGVHRRDRAARCARPDPSSWLISPRIVGTADIGGVRPSTCTRRSTSRRRSRTLRAVIARAGRLGREWGERSDRRPGRDRRLGRDGDRRRRRLGCDRRFGSSFSLDAAAARVGDHLGDRRPLHGRRRPHRAASAARGRVHRARDRRGSARRPRPAARSTSTRR